jgi:glycosyltransferase involved in cell wall biosynthesis
MTFIFWQNIISIHQSTFLEALGKKHRVLLVVEKELSNSRKTSGWQVPNISDVELVIAPKDNQIKQIIKDYNLAWHVISGLHAYDLATKALKFATQLGCKNIAIITESFETIGVKGLLRRLKYTLLSLKYRNKIKAIFVTGLPAKVCFENLYFPKDIIFDWGYFTNLSDRLSVNHNFERLPNLLFVGTVDKNKNLLPILPVVHKHQSLYSKFYIVGNGPLIKDLENNIATKSDVKYLGILKNSEIQTLMKECDLLILPSIYDGWGAVVNEALSNGMRVICSDNCGASILLDGEMRGSAFSNKDNNFESYLLKWLNMGKVTQSQREEIINWAKNHISGKVAAAYFIDCITFLGKEEQTKPKAPWL